MMVIAKNRVAVRSSSEGTRRNSRCNPSYAAKNRVAVHSPPSANPSKLKIRLIFGAVFWS